jgi:hypothetical protein
MTEQTESKPVFTSAQIEHWIAIGAAVDQIVRYQAWSHPTDEALLLKGGQIRFGDQIIGTGGVELTSNDWQDAAALYGRGR